MAVPMQGEMAKGDAMAAIDEFFRSSVTALYTLYALAGIAVLVASVLAARAFFRTFFNYHGTRIITCPETEKYAAVEVDAQHAALTRLFGTPQLRLEDCSRWPERQNCPQDCILQIDLSPIGCSLRKMLDGWYQGKECAFCHRTFGEIQWMEHRPALLSPAGAIVEWDAILSEAIPDALATHSPVCSQCKIVEPFRADHPDLVTDRPWKH
jgi:hypothetical protein